MTPKIVNTKALNPCVDKLLNNSKSESGRADRLLEKRNLTGAPEPFFGYICIMRMARILVAFTMLLAIVFRSLPDSVFDHFHDHKHTSSNNSHPFSVGEQNHNCHIEDWNFETLEAKESTYNYIIQISSSLNAILDPNHISIDPSQGIGRAPPIV